MRGYLQVYTGDGKGKTTAAIGLAVRAAGAGMRVYIAQFVKSGATSEITALKRFADQIIVEHFGTGRFIRGRPTPADTQAAERGLQRVRQIFQTGGFDVVILEEANVAAALGLFSDKSLLELAASRPEHVEVVITGRNASERIIAAADLVTEMRAVKHYYRQGVGARIGIEK
ncbi:MAG: cob(I)yrinic acid a,c-diamide adenosyltransferase [Deltaproteobacteria bacterium SG8_13]|nr:MAG: cob(I)yrinic acid a,c-diamide adenosyltransferase [Deltaproteobacteria bacterium SG8_13]